MVFTRQKTRNTGATGPRQASFPKNGSTTTRTGNDPAFNGARKRLKASESTSKPVKAPFVWDLSPKPGLHGLLLNLPAEIFGEICSYLDAIDLRHLSLTDATFCSVLASAKSNPIWRGAFRRVKPPMPDCPDDMSGSDFARFMLVETCMGCQKSPFNISADYFHRVLYCDYCYKSNIVSEKTVARLYPDFPLELLKYISSAAYSTDGASLATSRRRWNGSTLQYLKATLNEINKLWKSTSSSDDAIQPLNQLKKRLQKYADGRIEIGSSLSKWRHSFESFKSAERARISHERRSCLLSKMEALGYEERDFPRWHPDVNKSEILTDDEWERIRPALQEAAERNKNYRLSDEIWRRKAGRNRALQGVWNQAVAAASGTRIHYWERAACSDFNQFLKLPSVAALLDADHSVIPATDLESVKPEARRLAIEGRRRTLTKLDNILKGLPVDFNDDEEWSLLSDDQVISKLDTISAELVLAVSGFWEAKQKTIKWYPARNVLDPPATANLLHPLRTLAPGLIEKLLEAMNKPADTLAETVNSCQWRQKMPLYRCTRCDERFAPYLMFPDLVSHFVEKKIWFDKATGTSGKTLGDLTSSDIPPKLLNSHDWNAEGQLMVLDNPHEKARITKLQKQVEAGYGNEPEDYDGADFTTRSRRSTNQAPERRTRRICRLCPPGFSPLPMYFATLKLHIENEHHKEVDFQEDTAVFDRSQDTIPGIPCPFDVQFLNL